MLPYTSIARSYSTKTMLRPRIWPFNQEISPQLCGAVATLLNGAGVGNLLWGTNLLAVFTAPTVIPVSLLTFDPNKRLLIVDI
jgi:hypothetical protein